MKVLHALISFILYPPKSSKHVDQCLQFDGSVDLGPKGLSLLNVEQIYILLEF